MAGHKWSDPSDGSDGSHPQIRAELDSGEIARWPPLNPVIACSPKKHNPHQVLAPVRFLALHYEPSQYCRAWRYSLRSRIFNVPLVRICLRAHEAGREMVLPESIIMLSEPSLDSHQPHAPRQHPWNKRADSAPSRSQSPALHLGPTRTLPPKWMQIFARYRPIAYAGEDILGAELSKRHQTRRIFIRCLLGSNELSRLQSKDLKKYL